MGSKGIVPVSKDTWHPGSGNLRLTGHPGASGLSRSRGHSQGERILKPQFHN